MKLLAFSVLALVFAGLWSLRAPAGASRPGGRAAVDGVLNFDDIFEGGVAPRTRREGSVEIYTGPRGGRYWITWPGLNKHYIKKWPR